MKNERRAVRALAREIASDASLNGMGEWEAHRAHGTRHVMTFRSWRDSEPRAWDRALDMAEHVAMRCPYLEVSTRVTPVAGGWRMEVRATVPQTVVNEVVNTWP
jgi:hypothetical protein